MWFDVVFTSIEAQSSGFVAQENSTFRNLALTVSVPFIGYVGAPFT